MEITGKQRRALRGLAHGLKPLVQVGKEGLTDSLVAEIDRALHHHELIKVRLAGDRDERRRDGATLTQRLDAALAGLVGSTAILYRPRADPAERKIVI